MSVAVSPISSMMVVTPGIDLKPLTGGADYSYFGLLSGVIEHRSRIRLVVTIGAAVWWGQPHLNFYRGLSGIDSALFGCLAVLLLCGRSRPGLFTGAVALASFGVKCWAEIRSGVPIFAAAGSYETVPLAHLTGLIVGVTVACAPLSPHPETAGAVTASRCRGSDL